MDLTLDRGLHIDMPVFSKIHSLPREILEEIVVCSVESSFLGPPVTLASFQRVSRPIFEALGRENNSDLYARIFRIKFDTGFAERRLAHGTDRGVLNLGNELVRRCEGMSRLRRNTYPRADGDEQDDQLRIDLWMAYLMFLESKGKNSVQLIRYARVDRLALEFVMLGGRLHDGASDNGGWTLDNEINGLGLWLFWFTDGERVKYESATERENVLRALGCLYAGSFKYASSHAPLTHFDITSTVRAPNRVNTSIFSLATSPFSPSCTVPNHFGHKLTLARPLVTPPALLCSVVRLGCGGAAAVVGERTPATREEALQVGWTGPTRKDYEDFGKLETRCIEWGERDAGNMHEHDWSRLIVCYDICGRPTRRNKTFTPGMLDGIWNGRWLAIPPDFFLSLLDSAREHKQVDPHFQAPIFQQPIQFRIREHHQHNPEKIVPFEDMSTDGEGTGALRAWLPKGTTTAEHQKNGQLKIYDPNTQINYTYRTYDPMAVILDEELPHTEESKRVRDIILTADTTEDFGAAWGHDYYVGRVRDWDGLVVLVRNARPGIGRWVFRGYIHSNQNLVGRWRETGTPVNMPGWEGVWSMTKSRSLA